MSIRATVGWRPFDVNFVIRLHMWAGRVCASIASKIHGPTTIGRSTSEPQLPAAFLWLVDNLRRRAAYSQQRQLCRLRVLCALRPYSERVGLEHGVNRAGVLGSLAGAFDWCAFRGFPGRQIRL